VVVSDPLLLDNMIRHMRNDRLYSRAIKSMKSVFAFFFTADEAIITKLDIHIKQINIYTNF